MVEPPHVVISEERLAEIEQRPEHWFQGITIRDLCAEIRSLREVIASQSRTIRKLTGKNAASNIRINELTTEVRRLTNTVADEWDEGFEKGATWQPSGPSGIPSDPPRNPHRDDT